MHEREQRLITSRQVRVFRNGQERLVEASNVSPTGARIAGLRALPVGTPLTIHYNHLRIEAKVAWSSEGQAGVQFLTPLSAEDFLAFQVG